LQQLLQFTEVAADGESFEKLPRHERFAVAHANNLAALDSLNLRGV
jgi:hypothetical protein